MAHSRPYRIVLFVLVGAMLVNASAADKTPAPRGNTYASIAQLPDWSGAWVIPWDAFAAENLQLREASSPPATLLTPVYAAQRQALALHAAQSRAGHLVGLQSNSESCLPNGMPSVMRYAFAIELLFTPGRVTLLLEQGPMIRRIYTDGRAHSPDPDPSFAGESIGHWEGETLVVHTTAISPKAELFGAVKTSGQAQITERIHRRDKDHLQIDTVVEDPVALTRPWRTTRVYERSESGFFERICLDNNRDVNGDEPDLTPPKE